MLQQPADADPPSRKDYAAIVEDLDAGVGQILEALSARGLAENTLVVFVSDNGGEWLSRNAPFFHRKDTVWEGGIRVPAIFRWPAALPAGRTLSTRWPSRWISRRRSSRSPAVRPPRTRFEGIDLLPMLRGTAPPIERTLFWRVGAAPGQPRAVRSGDWKLVLDGSKQLLFDVSRDPGERDDLAAQHPDRVRALKGMIETWEKDVDSEAAAASGRVPR